MEFDGELQAGPRMCKGSKFKHHFLRGRSMLEIPARASSASWTLIFENLEYPLSSPKTFGEIPQDGTQEPEPEPESLCVIKIVACLAPPALIGTEVGGEWVIQGSSGRIFLKVTHRTEGFGAKILLAGQLAWGSFFEPKPLGIGAWERDKSCIGRWGKLHPQSKTHLNRVIGPINVLLCLCNPPKSTWVALGWGGVLGEGGRLIRGCRPLRPLKNSNSNSAAVQCRLIARTDEGSKRG